MASPIAEDARHAAAFIRDGGVVVYPTATVYGIGCNPLNADAWERIRAMKGRDADKPMLLLAASVDQVIDFCGGLDERTQALAERFWPGAVTMVLNSQKRLPGYLYGPGGGIAFRVTDYPEARKLAEACGYPLTSTSANRSGEAPALRYSEALDIFGGNADYIMKNVTPMGGVPSTVLDITGRNPQILREGAVSSETITGGLLDVLGH